MIIEIIDATFCKIHKDSLPNEKWKEIWTCLSYAQEFWKQGPFKKIRKEKIKSFLGGDGIFLTGFINKVIQKAYDIQEPITWQSALDTLEVQSPPQLKNTTLRPDQVDLINKACEMQRGVLKAPTGIGKTILGLGAMSCFPGANKLFLCHTKTLLRQTFEEMIKLGFDKKHITLLGGDHKFHTLKKITIALIQSFARLDPAVYANFFDMVIVDEAHIGMLPGSQYYKVLTAMTAPMRIGLTATLPNGVLPRLTLEGLIGPIIGGMSISEGVSLGLLAKPKLKLVRVPDFPALRDLRRYPEVYLAGIVNNDARNKLIVETTAELKNQGCTTLILVTHIEHGHNLVNMFASGKQTVHFAWGATEDEERYALQMALSKKELSCVIASSIWSHGVNIPSLGAVINAGGGMSEVTALQRIGRGLRVTDEKKEVLLIDFMDLSHHMLIKHLAYRLALYSDEGWL
ncbi:DEAD/DEAH box helicase [Patescibacteria group bacterium]|nr:DEAD/DEAH box helicase [Patescibacteria group bacterium]